MNRKLKQALIGVAAMLVLAATNASAQTAIAGSSAMYLEVGQAAGSVATIGGCVWDTTAKDFTLHDSRFTVAAADTAAAWISWKPSTPGNCATVIAGSEIIYLNTDSVLGNRCFFANPRCTVVVNTTPPTASATTLSPVTESPLPASVLTDITGISISIAATDIRPEDAKFATVRALAGCGTPVTPGSQYLGLGYHSGDGIVGAGSIIKAGTGGNFNVGNFNLMGIDPYTSAALPGNFVVTSVGAVPIVIFVNPANASGFGNIAVSNIDRATLAGYQDGTYGTTGAMIPAGAIGNGTTVVLREPLSGTYNVMEYAIPNSVQNQSSQDVGLAALNANAAGVQFPPLNCSSIGGTPALSALTGATGTANPLVESVSRNSGPTSNRARAIGTGNMVKAVLATPDSLGYAFWSQANFANATAASGKYLTVDGIDPIQETWSGGLIPTINNDLLGDVSLAHVKDGTYPIWSIVRLVSDPGANATLAANLRNAAATFLSPGQPDFVPLNQLAILRSHFAPPTVSFPSAGTNLPSNPGSTDGEAGGDVGGLVYTALADSLYENDNSSNTGNTGHRQ
jgi:ABC-type phosphate transport system substrate-binding protein